VIFSFLGRTGEDRGREERRGEERSFPAKNLKQELYNDDPQV